MILGQTAGASRFGSKDAFARVTATAPIPVWSANTVRVRLNRGGNRTLNCALHLIAVTQARGIGAGKAYITKQLAAGKTRSQALRLLRRQLSDTVFGALLADEHRQPRAATTTLSHAAWHRIILGARPATAEIVKFIDSQKESFGVEPVCAELQVAPSSYYAAKKRPPSARALRDEQLKGGSSACTPKTMESTAHGKCGTSCAVRASTWRGARCSG